MLSTRSRLPILSLAAAVGGLTVAAVLLSRPEGLIGAAFDGALAASGPIPTDAAHVRPSLPGRGIAASSFDPRHLRPSSLPSGLTLPIVGPLKVGDRMKIATSGGEQWLEVVGVHPLGASRLIGDETSDPKLVVVTLRPDDDTGATVRLIVEDPAERAVPGKPVSRRAL